jgi:hypothetical protein
MIALVAHHKFAESFMRGDDWAAAPIMHKVYLRLCPVLTNVLCTQYAVPR